MPAQRVCFHNKITLNLTLAYPMLARYWLNEFFNRMEKNGRFLTPTAKAELEEACESWRILSIDQDHVCAHTHGFEIPSLPQDQSCMSYATLAKMASERSDRLWPLRPKMHAALWHSHIMSSIIGCTYHDDSLCADLRDTKKSFSWL